MNLADALKNVQEAWKTRLVKATLIRDNQAEQVWLTMHSAWEMDWQDGGRVNRGIESHVRRMLINKKLWVEGDSLRLEPVEFQSLEDVVPGGHRTSVVQIH